MTIRTKDEQKAYLDGYKMCADCFEKYLTPEGKQKLECCITAVKYGVKIVESEDKTMGPYEKAIADISDIMLEIELPNNDDIISDFRNQTITELEDNFTFMIELLRHINDILDKIGGV